MKKFFLYIAAVLAVVIGLASVAGLVYFGLVVMLVGGLIQIVHALKQVDIPTMEVVWGIVRVMATGLATGLLFWVLLGLNAVVWAAINAGFDSCKPKRFPYRRF